MPKTRLLIVDDSQIDRMILIRAFNKANIPEIELIEACDATSALEHLCATQVDAVFLDVNMPGENGFYVLHTLREKQPRTWPLVFMFSSSDHPGDIQRAYDEMATAYLCKPSDFSKTKDLVTYCSSLIAIAPKDRPAPAVVH